MTDYDRMRTARRRRERTEVAGVAGLGCLALVAYLALYALVIAGGIAIVVWTLRALEVIQ